MERKIGEIFRFGGEWHQCVEQPEKYDNTVCELCDFHGIGNCALDKCSGTYRSDKKHVIFKKLERVGKPITVKDRTFQCLNAFKTVCTGCVFLNSKRGCDKFHYIDAPCPDREIWVEIKQTKDMEEKKQCGDNRFRTIARAKEYLFQATNIAEDKKELEVLDSFLLRCWQMGWLDKYDDTKQSNSEKIGKNLRPFDIQKAREGKPVCTRDGRKARIICFDFRDADEICCIIAAVDYGEAEKIHYYDLYGKYRGGDSSEYDLMMLPEKKSGWVNVYKNQMHDTLESAEDGHKGTTDYIKTIKVEWEE